MCGIIGAIAERNTTPILIEGLKRLEYRGYDSAGVALLTAEGRLARCRAVGKVQALEAQLQHQPLSGRLGIAHTRWATHGAPCERNAHPHVSGTVAVVHNGIIENHAALRQRLQALGYGFESDTDTEVIAHLVAHYLRAEGDLARAVVRAVGDVRGAYALGVICAAQPDRLIATRHGSPLVVGVGIGEHFIGSDVFALLPVTQHFIYLEEGDIAELTREAVTIRDRTQRMVTRPVVSAEHAVSVAEKGSYRHYMIKEIFEQPLVIAETLEGRVHEGCVLESAFGHAAPPVLARVRQVHIVACGTSFHAGLVARYWLEELGIPCMVELASEYRYRPVVVPPATLLVTISQSGETADTLAALRKAKGCGAYLAALAICNVAQSSLVRESDLVLLTRAGPEIGVASTKAFTTQLTALQLLALALGHHFGLAPEREQARIAALQALPCAIEDTLELNGAIAQLAERFVEKQHALFLGRGAYYPIAMEGALKLKEISYIHAEAYAAGELKHGPLALVDAEMPVICVLPNNGLREKVLSNLQEVRARGGELFLFAQEVLAGELGEDVYVLPVAATAESVAPIVYTVPLQLLAYHVAVLKGTDVDQPRNLAKSVTVE